jgi:PilZ domain
MLCQEPETVGLAMRACRELGVELQHYSCAKTAAENFPRHSFQGVIIDDEDGPGAAHLLREVQASTGRKNTLIIALARPDAALDAVFGAGTHLVIYKPLTQERLRNGFRAISALMGRRRRRASSRLKVNLTATLAVNETEEIPVRILDISVGGAAISVQRSFPTAKTLTLRFALPGEQHITTAAELVWRDVRGNVGIEFVDSDDEFAESMASWMKTHSQTP